MPVALSSLRVSADMDASGFVRGTQQISDSSARAGEGADRLGQSLARQDAALTRVIPGMSSLSKQLLDGYSQGSKFYSTLERIENSLNKGMGADRAEAMLRSLYARTGQMADATELWNNQLQMTAGIVDKINQQKFAQNYQAGLNQSFGIGTPGKSAQESAEAFFAQYGGLEGVARAKAQQIATAFSTDLDRRLVEGTGKSARDSAQVFQEEMDRLDNIARLKAQQVGQNFQNSLNESFGIGAKPKSAAASASVFQDFEAQQQAFAKQQKAFDDLQVQYGKGIDDLKAKYVPAYSAQRNYNNSLKEINELYRAGKIDQDQYIGAINMADRGLTEAEKAAKLMSEGVHGASAAAAFGNTQFMALTAAIRHSIDSIAAGRPVFQTLASELGNISYGLSGSGGFFGAIKAIGSGFLSFLTPVTVGIGAIAAGFVAATAAAIHYGQVQADIARQLAGIGRGSGATAGNINSIGNQNATTTGLSIAEATQFAATLAATGRIGVEQIGPLVALGHDLAKTFGVDAADAAKVLAGAMANPARGAEQLNERLGFLNQANLELIRNLTASGRQFEAQNELYVKLKSNLADAADLTTGWGKAWTAVSNTVSNIWTKMGEAVFGGANTLENKLEEAKAKLLSLQDSKVNPGFLALGFNDPSVDAAIRKVQDEIIQLTAKIKAAADASAEVKRNLESIQIGKVISQLVPEVQQLQTLKNNVEAISKAQTGTGIDSSFSFTEKEIELANQRAIRAANTFKSEIQNRIDQAFIQLQAVDNRSPSARAEQARQQTLIELRGKGVNEEEAARQADLAAKIAAGGQTALDNIQRQRIGTLGQLADVDQQVASKELELNNLSREGVTFSEKQRQAILDLAREQANLTKLQEGVTNGIFNMGQAAEHAKLHIQNLIADGTIKSAQDYANATLAVAKNIQNMKDQAAIAAAPLEGLKRLELEAGSLRKQMDIFATDTANNVGNALLQIANGSVSAKEGFRQLGLQVITSLEQMIIKMTIVAPLAAGLQAILGGATGGTSGLVGGLFGLFKSANGNVFQSGMITPYAYGGIVDKPTLFPMANGAGLMGEAGPEAVMPLRRGADGRLGVAASGGASGPSVTIQQSFDFRGSENGVEDKIRALMPQFQKQTVAAAVKAVASAHRASPSYLSKS